MKNILTYHFEVLYNTGTLRGSSIHACEIRGQTQLHGEMQVQNE